MSNNPWELFGNYITGNLWVGGKKLNPLNPFETIQTINGYKEQLETPKTSVDSQLTQAQSQVSNTQNLQNQARQQQAAQTVLNSQKSWNPVDRITGAVQAIGQMAGGQTQYDDTLKQQKADVQKLASKQYAERAESKVRRWNAEPLMQGTPRTTDTMQEKLMNTATYDEGTKTLRAGQANPADAFWTAGNVDNLRYAMLTDGEKARYYSIKNSQGQDTANQYLDDLNPYLNARYSQFYGKTGKDNALLSTMGGFQGGLESVATGIKQTGSRLLGYQNPVDEMTTEQADRDLAPQLTGWQSTVRNIANVTGQALPAVAATAATGGAGAAPMLGMMAGGALTAASTWGNDYRQDRSLGYTDAQATTHASADAAVQFALNSIPGGVAGKGLGIASKFLAKAPIVNEAVTLFSKSPGVVRAFGTVAKTYGREVAENVMQGAASEAIRNATLDEHNSLMTTEGLKQALESSFVSHAYRAPEYAAKAMESRTGTESVTYERAADESAGDATHMLTNPDGTQTPVRMSIGNNGTLDLRDEAGNTRNMTVRELADAVQNGQIAKIADTELQDATHMLTNPDGTQTPVRMNLDSDGTVTVRDVRGNESKMTVQQLGEAASAGKVNRIEDNGATDATHVFNTPDGEQTPVRITENADGSFAMRDAQGNAETVHPELLKTLAQAGVLARAADNGGAAATHVLTMTDGTQTPVILDMKADGTVDVRGQGGRTQNITLQQLGDATQNGRITTVQDAAQARAKALQNKAMAEVLSPEYAQKVARQSIEDYLTNPGKRAVQDALQQQATQKEYRDAVHKAVVQMMNSGKVTGEPVQDVANTGNGGRMEGEESFEPDIVIGKSVGAKAKNYNIVSPNGDIFNLTEGSRIANVKVIAGAGRDRQIDVIESLLNKYGGDPLQWKKCKGLGRVDVDGESLLAEFHWYEEPSVGRVEFKIKPQPGGELFMYED